MFACTLHPGGGDSSHVPADPRPVCACVHGGVRAPPDATCSLPLQGYDNTESSVRKASVFCLVAIYSVIGEDLKPHLAQLTGSKVASAARRLVLTDGGALSSPRAVVSGRPDWWPVKRGVLFAPHCVLGLCKRRGLTVMST